MTVTHEGIVRLCPTRYRGRLPDVGAGLGDRHQSEMAVTVTHEGARQVLFPLATGEGFQTQALPWVTVTGVVVAVVVTVSAAL